MTVTKQDHDLNTILVRRSSGVVTVTLNRPLRKNAITTQMWHELLDTLHQVRRNRGDRVLVLTGAGGAFCSGADVEEMSTNTAHPLEQMRLVTEVATALTQLPQPSIAAVRGAAVGGGMNLALLCDLIVASDTARFSEIFTRRALSVDTGGSWTLPRRIGLHRAMELVLFADTISGTDAERIGLVNRVVADDELEGFVDDWAQRLAEAPPLAVSQSKQLIARSGNVTLEESLEMEAAAQSVNSRSRDLSEAIAAFVEKRQPIFEGR